MEYAGTIDVCTILKIELHHVFFQIIVSIHPLHRSITDTHSYFGFYADVIPRTLGNLVYLEIVSMFMLYQVGFCTYIDACSDDYKSIMKRLTEYTTRNNDGKTIRSSDNYIKTTLKEAIELHGEMLK